MPPRRNPANACVTAHFRAGLLRALKGVCFGQAPPAIQSQTVREFTGQTEACNESHRNSQNAFERRICAAGRGSRSTVRGARYRRNAVVSDSGARLGEAIYFPAGKDSQRPDRMGRVRAGSTRIATGWSPISAAAS